MVRFYDDEDEEDICTFCDGSGEGYAPGSRCLHCSPSAKKEAYLEEYGDREED